MEHADAPSVETVRELLAEGRVFPAYDLVVRLRAGAPHDLDLAALEARTLDRLGRTADARDLLETLHVADGEDPEALGLLAALRKRDALARAGDARRAGLAAARDLYARGWKQLGGSWFGINVATLDRVLGRGEAAAEEARAVLAVLDLESARDGDDREAETWRLATAAEARLVAGPPAEAVAAYRALRAAALPARAWSALASARRNARLILEAEGSAATEAVASEVLAALRIPPVVLATGHLADRPGRTPPRFSPDRIATVRAALGAALDDLGASAGFSSLAAGADLLFQDELARRGVPRHVLLPFDEASFLRESVVGRGHYGWTDDFRRLWRTADRRYQASRYDPGEDGAGFAYANEMLLGLALLEADRLETEVVALAVWDGRPGDGRGGTASAVARWRASGVLADLHVIPLDGDVPHADAAANPTDASTPAAEASLPAAARDHVAAMLFADARGFSRLDEAQTAAFVERYLGVVAGVQARFGESIAEANTWGDGLFYVFRDVETAGRFALEVAEALERAKPDLAAWGLPDELGLRMALHAGPVRTLPNPITGRTGAFGAQVSVAARLEPVTPVDQAFASEAFAALCRARGVQSFHCRYVGRRELAKRWGAAAIYRLER